MRSRDDGLVASYEVFVHIRPIRLALKGASPVAPSAFEDAPFSASGHREWISHSRRRPAFAKDAVSTEVYIGIQQSSNAVR